MDGGILGIIYCADADKYRIFCDICDKFAIDRSSQHHLKSQTHNNNFRKKQTLYIIFYFK